MDHHKVSMLIFHFFPSIYILLVLININSKWTIVCGESLYNQEFLFLSIFYFYTLMGKNLYLKEDI